MTGTIPAGREEGGKGGVGGRPGRGQVRVALHTVSSASQKHMHMPTHPPGGKDSSGPSALLSCPLPGTHYCRSGTLPLPLDLPPLPQSSTLFPISWGEKGTPISRAEKEAYGCNGIPPGGGASCVPRSLPLAFHSHLWQWRLTPELQLSCVLHKRNTWQTREAKAGESELLLSRPKCPRPGVTVTKAKPIPGLLLGPLLHHAPAGQPDHCCPQQCSSGDPGGQPRDLLPSQAPLKRLLQPLT